MGKKQSANAGIVSLFLRIRPYLQNIPIFQQVKKISTKKILNHSQDKNIHNHTDYIVRTADPDIDRNHSHEYAQKQSLLNKARVKVLAAGLFGFALLLSIAIMAWMLLPTRITVYGYQRMKQLNLRYHPVGPSILQDYVKTNEQNTFLAIQVDVPIRYFMIEDYDHDMQKLRDRWDNYIREHKSSYVHYHPMFKKNSTPFGDLLVSSLEEHRGPTLPWMDFIPLQDEMFAVLDPQLFLIKDSQGRENRGCFIAIVNGGSLSNTALMSFSSWEGKLELIMIQGFIGFEQLMSLAMSEPIDKNEKITIAVVFHIPSDGDPLTYKVHLNGFRPSKIPQVKLELQKSKSR